MPKHPSPSAKRSLRSREAARRRRACVLNLESLEPGLALATGPLGRGECTGQKIHHAAALQDAALAPPASGWPLGLAQPAALRRGWHALERLGGAVERLADEATPSTICRPCPREVSMIQATRGGRRSERFRTMDAGPEASDNTRQPSA